MPKVRTGLDVLVAQEFAPLRGLRVGLVTHPAAVDRELRQAIELFAAPPGLTLAAIFGPEHGLLGQAQDLIAGAGGQSKGHGCRMDTCKRLCPLKWKIGIYVSDMSMRWTESGGAASSAARQTPNAKRISASPGFR